MVGRCGGYSLLVLVVHPIEIVFRLHKLIFPNYNFVIAEVKEQAQMLGEWKVVLVNREYSLTLLQIVSHILG